jgi:DNA-binding FrmR family transcriptional regulator
MPTKAAMKLNNLLSDESDVTQVTNRIKRARGQLDAVLRMIDDGRDCSDIITQMAAASKAVNTAAFTLLSSGLRECVAENRKDSDEVAAQLQKLFASLA